MIVFLILDLLINYQSSTMWWSKFSSRTYQLASSSIAFKFTNFSNKFSKIKTFNIFLIPTASTLGYLYFSRKSQALCADSNNQNIKISQFEKRISSMESQIMNTNNKSRINKLLSIISHTLRFFQLLIIFMPVIVLYPLTFFKTTKQLWLNLFVQSVQWAGVVWIKAFQYMSHRRDMIGPEIAQKFVHLRENAPQHSFEETKKNFKTAYGKQINQIFQQFEEKPLASGSVSQVYKAQYKGKKVAVKVRHPQVDKYIQRDINLLFFLSKILSILSNRFSLPVTQTSMKKTLIDQINFINQHDNLLIFNEMFKGNKSIKFPLPFTEDTRDSVLVQSFAEGVPITYFETNRHKLNSVIARLGATTFFEMLMKNNFIHADCHGGNMLVEIQEKSCSFFSDIIDFIKERYYNFEQYCVSTALQNETLKKLYCESKREEQKVRKILKQCKQKVVVTLIDVGMVIRLDEDDRQNFINFLKSVLHGDGNKCAEMIYHMSSFDGHKIIQGTFMTYLAELRSLFSPLNGQLDDLQGVQLLTGMLDIIRDHNMKLQGQFATLITNMLVLEGMAKDIDPQINILKCAVPYFKYAQAEKQNNNQYYEPRTYQ